MGIKTRASVIASRERRTTMGIRKSVSVIGVLVVAVLIAAASGCGAAEPQFPSGPTTMTLGWPAGGAADTAARALAEATTKHLGQPIVVQNLPGAGGATGAVAVAKAKPDGYNILWGTTALVSQPYFEDVPYDPVRDFLPFLQVDGYVTLIVVRPDSPLKNIKDFVDYAKQNPGKINYSTTGFGSSQHLLMEMLSNKAGMQLTHVPFKSLAEGITAVLGGHIEAGTCSWSDCGNPVKEGRLRGIAIFMPNRDKEFGDIPTVKESGYDITAYGWHALAAPKGTPDKAIQKLHDAYKKGLDEESFKNVMRNLRMEILYMGPAETTAKWKQEFEFYGAMAKLLKDKK